MHKIQAKKFTMDDFSCEHLMGGYLEQMRRIIDDLKDVYKRQILLVMLLAVMRF